MEAVVQVEARWPMQLIRMRQLQMQVPMLIQLLLRLLARQHLILISITIVLIMALEI